ncbi:MAG: phosphatase PAP2 family protein [Actinomycetota bacterium]
MEISVASEGGGRRRLRRPSGEPPPLPREPGWSRWVWPSVAVIAVGVVLGVLYDSHTISGNDVGMRAVADLRTPTLDAICTAIVRLASPAVILGLRLAVLVVLILYRRFRHLVVFLGTFLMLDAVVAVATIPLAHPRIPALVDPGAYTFPNRAIASLGITLFSIPYVLVPAGRMRRRARRACTAVLAIVVLAALETAYGYLLGMVYSGLLAAAVAYLVYGAFVPDEAFPVSYEKGGNAAHLDLAGPRGQAVKTAVADQLGLAVVTVEPFGQEGSGGSTPLRLTLEDGEHLFGKVLATSHARADRWYRIGRTILYGQLEDETPFGAVRRLVEYEDYALRLLDDVGVRVAKTYGVLELTPEREYLLVTEFFEGAQTMGHAEVTDEVIAEGMALIRTLWDEGLAHRDVKPANLLVLDGHLQLVDVSGLEVRPSPWRQAVDLANMLLVMALPTGTERVYAIATQHFTPEELGEALACAVGLAIPTQLQALMKADGRDLLGEFRALAPPHEPVSIQRWSVRRLALTAAAAIAVLVAAGLGWFSFRTIGV